MSHASTRIPAALAERLAGLREALARELPRARRGGVRGVHQARVASRRLRALAAIAAAIEPEPCRELSRDLRRLTRALGAVREIDVTRGVLADAGRRFEWPGVLRARLDRLSASERIEARLSMRQRLDRLVVASVLDRLRRLEQTLRSAGSGRRLASRLSARLMKRGREFERALEAAGVVYRPERLHALRIAAKKLRYTLEVAEATGCDAATAPRRELKDLQERLGRLHDLHVAEERLRALAEPRGTSRRALRQFHEFSRAIGAEARQVHGECLRRVPAMRRVAELAGAVALSLVAGRPRRMGATARQRGVSRRSGSR